MCDGQRAPDLQSPKGSAMDNIFIEHPWRSLKQEAVCLVEIRDGFDARRLSATG